MPSVGVIEPSQMKELQRLFVTRHLRVVRFADFHRPRQTIICTRRFVIT